MLQKISALMLLAVVLSFSAQAEAMPPNERLSVTERKSLESWRLAVRERIKAHQSYKKFQHIAANSTVQITCKLGRDNFLTDLNMQLSSNSDVIDKTALATLIQSTPLPAPPDNRIYQRKLLVTFNRLNVDVQVSQVNDLGPGRFY